MRIIKPVAVLALCACFADVNSAGVTTAVANPNAIWQTTWSTLNGTTCSSGLQGTRAWVTDVGVNGSQWYCDGTQWQPVGQITLCNTGVKSASTSASETVVSSCAVPSGLAKANSAFFVLAQWSWNGTTSVNVGVELNATSGTDVSGTAIGAAAAAGNGANMPLYVSNRNATNSQVTFQTSSNCYVGTCAGTTPRSTAVQTSGQFWFNATAATNGTLEAAIEQFRVDLIRR